MKRLLIARSFWNFINWRYTGFFFKYHKYTVFFIWINHYARNFPSFLLFSFKFSFKTAKNETNFWLEIVWIYPSYLSVETVDFSWTIFFVETGNSSWIHAQDRQLDGTCVIRAVKKLGLESGQPIMGNEHGAGSFVPGSFGQIYDVFRLFSVRGTQHQFSENICSEDDLRSKIFGTFVVKFLACLPLLGFLNI